ncbi:hypothetical protein TIFTF001_028048 [Ficus carica]|uniref:Uncharacterized protein n=1 Tax=Ficus carica TaxID=3494 RepID=A0AA88J0L6_FICCA|nr:hypothetical protein TIFTF001_028048 [Ficus carica]
MSKVPIFIKYGEAGTRPPRSLWVSSVKEHIDTSDPEFPFLELSRDKDIQFFICIAKKDMLFPLYVSMLQCNDHCIESKEKVGLVRKELVRHDDQKKVEDRCRCSSNDDMHEKDM